MDRWIEAFRIEVERVLPKALRTGRNAGVTTTSNQSGTDILVCGFVSGSKLVWSKLQERVAPNARLSAFDVPNASAFGTSPSTPSR